METGRLDRIEKAIADLAETDRKRVEEDRKRAEEFRREMKAREEADRKRAEEFRMEMKARDEADRKRAEEFRMEMKARDEADRKRAEELRKEHAEGMDRLRKSQEEHAKGMDRLRKSQEDTDRRLKNLGDKMEGFMGNYGAATEELFYRCFEERPFLGEVEFDSVGRRIKIDENSAEFDVVLTNGECVGIVEVKSKAHPKDLDSLIDRKIRHFKLDYPEFENHAFYFGIASLVTHRDLIDRAREKGIFLLTQKGDNLEIVNDEVRTF